MYIYSSNRVKPPWDYTGNPPDQCSIKQLLCSVFVVPVLLAISLPDTRQFITKVSVKASSLAISLHSKRFQILREIQGVTFFRSFGAGLQGFCGVLDCWHML